MDHFLSGGARPRVWRHGFFASRIISQVPGSSEAPSLGRSPWRPGWTNCFSAAEIGPGEPATSLTHRGPTLTRVPEKWIR
jgi:hypothetical protein